MRLRLQDMNQFAPRGCPPARQLARCAGVALALSIAAMPWSPFSASAQLAPLYTDDSINAAEALTRLNELAASGNVGEASRVAQSLLTDEGDRVIEMPGDSNLFGSVRARVHEALRSRPALLRRYREDEQPEAARLVQAEQLQAAEQTRWMTRAGLDAALRLVRRRLDAGSFDAAWLTLRPLQQHPDLAGIEGGAGEAIAVDAAALKDAARLAIELSRYLARDNVKALASSWASRAGVEAELAAATPIAPPARASVRGITPMDPQGEVDAAKVPGTPLAWFVTTPARGGDNVNEDDVRFGGDAPDRALADAWIMPTIAGDSIVVNDGMQISAWDRYTLMPIWTLRPPAPLARAAGTDMRDEQIVQTRLIEDVNTVAIEGNVGVGVTGYAITTRRMGDPRVHAFDVATGKPLWSQNVTWLDRQLSDGGTIRGPAVISDGTVIVTVRKNSNARRVTSLYAAGLDLYSGELKWLRLVGSVGMLAYAQSFRATDAAIAHDGIVYRSDALGVVFAIEAATGRVAWVKRLTPPPDGTQTRVSNPIAQPWACATPVLDGNTLLVIDPTTRDILRIDANTGATLATVPAAASGNARYLVRTRDWLACVSETKATFLPIATLDTNHAVRIEIETLGRVTTSGTRFAMPIRAGVALVDPANINAITTLALQSTGNVLLDQGHAVVADATRVQSYLTWDLARALLQKQATSRPGDPQPVLTLAELAYRAGKPEQVAAAADRVLDIADQASDPAAGANARRQLFALLWNILEAGREKFDLGIDAAPPVRPENAADKEAQAETSSQRPPESAMSALTLPLLDDIATRLGRAAESPTQRACHALATGWISSARATKPTDVARAVEAYQSILGDDAVRSASAGAISAAGPSGEVARDRLVALIGRWGIGVYASFSAQAQRELSQLAPTAGAKEIEAIARRYPCALGVPRAWANAADIRLKAGDATRASADLAAGVDAARRLASWGVTDAGATSQELARSLFALLAKSGREGHALRLAREFPAAAGASDLSALRSSLGTLNRRARIGRVAGSESGASRILAGWTIDEPIIIDGPGHATDQAPLINLTEQAMAVFAPRIEDGRLKPLWQRTFDRARQPKFVRIDWDAAYVFWPASRGGSVERINTDGTSAWRTPEMRELFKTQPQDPDNPVTFETLSGRVKTTDLLIAMDEQSLCVIERSGRMGRFDLATGTIMWSGRLPLSRVYDAVLVGGTLLAAGTSEDTPRGTNPEQPLLCALPKEGGEPRVFDTLAKESKGPGVRWLRAAKDAVIVGFEEGVAMVSVGDGALRWGVVRSALQRTADCRVIGDRVFVVDQERTLQLIDAASGGLAEDRIEDRGRLRDDGVPTRLAVVNDHLLIVGSRGVVVLNKDGVVVGEDSTDERTIVGTPIVGENAVAFVGGEVPPTQAASAKDAVGLRVVATPSGRMLQSTALLVPRLPSAVWAIDDKLLVTSGQATIVLDAAP